MNHEPDSLPVLVVPSRLRVLHVVRRADDHPLDALQLVAAGATRALLLLQDGVGVDGCRVESAGIACYYSAEDAAARDASPPGVALDDGQIIDLVFAVEKVVNW